MLLAIEIENYRSLQRFRTELEQLNVIVGANGAGKTNVYQALRLIAEASRGRFLQAMAEEGGLPSVKWAGQPLPKRTKKAPFRMRFGVEFDDICYRMELGMTPRSEHPPNPDWLFYDDPQVKEELIWPRGGNERSFLFKRKQALVNARDDNGRIIEYPLSIATWELGLAELREPKQFPELYAVQSRLGLWRFYHGFRSDHDAPARRAHIGFHSPVLHEDGSNLAAALRTIIEIGDVDGLQEAVSDAFGGGGIEIQRTDDLRFHVSLRVPGLYRSLRAHELSDGQLRFLCLAAALLSPRPPNLMVFNEPEASLHPDLLPAIARLVARAARASKICLTTHSMTLVSELQRASRPFVIQLRKEDGATVAKTL
jgi:predicted ATPase